MDQPLVIRKRNSLWPFYEVFNNFFAPCRGLGKILSKREIEKRTAKHKGFLTGDVIQFKKVYNI
jgi:hypothetical protein